jgi:hypothetical protein
MSTYLTKAEYKELKEVPDPYFGGPEGFAKVSTLMYPGLYTAHRASEYAPTLVL